MARSSRKNGKALIAENVRFAKRSLSTLVTIVLLQQLRELTRSFSLSLRSGDLLLLGGGWYVTHGGLIRLAMRRHCLGMQVEPVLELCEHETRRYAFRATVYKSAKCGGFMGYGDADPSNVSVLVHGAEMRVAETRAVNRALRKAYGIGLCSVEEIGTVPSLPEKRPSQKTTENGNGAGPKVRDRLCQIIRHHKLDPELVKAYAVDFCGTATLKQASRTQVEHFVDKLSDFAQTDRNGLLCQLNSYARTKEEVVA